MFSSSLALDTSTCSKRRVFNKLLYFHVGIKFIC